MGKRVEKTNTGEGVKGKKVTSVTMIDLIWSKLGDKHLKSSWKRSTKRTHTHTTHTHNTYSLTDTPIHKPFPLYLTHQYIRNIVDK